MLDTDQDTAYAMEDELGVGAPAIDPRVAYCTAEVIEGEEGTPLRHGIHLEDDGSDSRLEEACHQALPLRRELVRLCQQRDDYLTRLGGGTCETKYEPVSVRYACRWRAGTHWVLFEMLQGTDLDLYPARYALAS